MSLPQQALSKEKYVRQATERISAAEKMVLLAEAQSGREVTSEQLSSRIDDLLRFYYYPNEETTPGEWTVLDKSEHASFSSGSGIYRNDLLDPKTGRVVSTIICRYRDLADRSGIESKYTAMSQLDRAVSRQIEREQISAERAREEADRERSRADTLQRQLDEQASNHRLALLRLAELERQLAEAKEGGWLTPEVLQSLWGIVAKVLEGLQSEQKGQEGKIHEERFQALTLLLADLSTTLQKTPGASKVLQSRPVAELLSQIADVVDEGTASEEGESEGEAHASTETNGSSPPKPSPNPRRSRKKVKLEAPIVSPGAEVASVACVTEPTPEEPKPSEEEPVTPPPPSTPLPTSAPPKSEEDAGLSKQRFVQIMRQKVDLLEEVAPKAEVSAPAPIPKDFSFFTPKAFAQARERAREAEEQQEDEDEEPEEDEEDDEDNENESSEPSSEEDD
jgi:hypothetical protein